MKLFVKKGIDKRSLLCYTQYVKEIEAHCTISIARKMAAKAVRKRRGCRSGCGGRHLGWQLGEYPFCCRKRALRRAIRGIKKRARALYMLRWVVSLLWSEGLPFFFHSVKIGDSVVVGRSRGIAVGNYAISHLSSLTPCSHPIFPRMREPLIPKIGDRLRFRPMEWNSNH